MAPELEGIIDRVDFNAITHGQRCSGSKSKIWLPRLKELRAATRLW
jgi:hypothetical protein